MKLTRALIPAALAALLPLTVMAQGDIQASAFSIKVVEVPEKEKLGKKVGTMVFVEVYSTHKGDKITATEIDRSKISFTDSTGKDLFAAGKKTRIRYDEQGITAGGLRDVENALSECPPLHIGRDKVRPGCVYLRCYALATPDPEATSVSIRGDIKVFKASKESKTAIITKGQLTSGKEFKLGDLSFQFKGFGAGSKGGRVYKLFELSSIASVESIEVVGKEGDKSPVVDDGSSFEVYHDELLDSDEIRVTYLLPEQSTLSLDEVVFLEAAEK